MMKPKSNWVAILKTGDVVIAPPDTDEYPFLGSLDVKKVSFFSVGNCSVDVENGHFLYRKRKILTKKGTEFFAVRRNIVHQTGEKKRKIVFGFKEAFFEVNGKKWELKNA